MKRKRHTSLTILIGFILPFINIKTLSTTAALQNVSTPGRSADEVSYIPLKLNGKSTSYTIYRGSRHSNKATLIRFNGTSWETVGSV